MKGEAEQLVYGKNLDEVSDLMRACTHPLRIQIVSFIHAHKSSNVNTIFEALNLEQSVASQQLKILRDANIVLTHRTGKFVFYSLNYELLALVANRIEKHFGS
jgi:DNA-binding transcriptional ArsR family regulator